MTHPVPHPGRHPAPHAVPGPPALETSPASTTGYAEAELRPREGSQDKDEERAEAAGEAGGTRKPPFMTANHLAVSKANGPEATNKAKLTEEARAMSSSQSKP